MIESFSIENLYDEIADDKILIKKMDKEIERLSILCNKREEEIDRLNNKVSELENINEKIGLALDSAENKVDRLNNIILNQQKRIDKTIQAIDEILIYNDVSDTTSAFGNAPRELKFYLSECDTLEEFDKLTELKENNKDE